jgi:hypothetical protein
MYANEFMDVNRFNVTAKIGYELVKGGQLAVYFM